MRIAFTACEAIGLERDEDQWWVLPTKLATAPVEVNTRLWVLPPDRFSRDHAWQVQLHGGKATATPSMSGLIISVEAPSATLSKAEARPHDDLFGQRFSFQIESGATIA